MSSQPIAEQVCPYCGATVQPRVLKLGFGRTTTVPGLCGCPVAVAKRERELAEEEVREAECGRRQIDGILRRAGVGARFVDAIPDATYLPLIEGGTGLYLTGKQGRGKSHLAAATLKAYVLAHTRDMGASKWCSKRCAFTTGKGLLDAIGASFAKRDESVEDAIARFSRADLLVMDDLGKESPTAWALENLYQVINARYEDLRPTIITSQYERDELGRKLSQEGDPRTGQAIASRLAEMCERVEITGPDRRLS